MSGERWEQVLEAKFQQDIDEIQRDLDVRRDLLLFRIPLYSESPIERILAAAIATLHPTAGCKRAFYLDGGELTTETFRERLEHLGRAASRRVSPGQYGGWTGLYAHQIRHGRYQLDFLFGAVLYDEDGHRAQCLLAVECDGHAYHERTKEQAAHDRTRDRALQADGLAVFRFTGSQLYNDPLGCAAEIYSFMDAWASPHRKSIQARVRGVPA